MSNSDRDLATCQFHIGMSEGYLDVLFSLLRVTLVGGELNEELADKDLDWERIYADAEKQSLLGVLWTAVEQLPRDKQPPMEILLSWAGDAEMIRGMNRLLDQEAARLTKVFHEASRRTVILKGQANARLYPDKLLRQPGDIDIWVEGGKKSVVKLIKKLGLEPENELAMRSYHHIHLAPTKEGVQVEVHFRPSSGNYNPVTNRRLQCWLEQEIVEVTHVKEGFNVPSMKFALIMQLSHIQRHLFTEGVGLRQLCDYFLLLRAASDKERNEVSAFLKKFGLKKTSSALMWVLQEVFHLDEQQMFCKPDVHRGKWLLSEILEGGNFGLFSEYSHLPAWKRFASKQYRRIRLLGFDFQEGIWTELIYWKDFFLNIPLRIKYRTWSLSDI